MTTEEALDKLLEQALWGIESWCAENTFEGDPDWNDERAEVREAYKIVKEAIK